PNSNWRSVLVRLLRVLRSIIYSFSFNGDQWRRRSKHSRKRAELLLGTTNMARGRLGALYSLWRQCMLITAELCPAQETASRLESFKNEFSMVMVAPHLSTSAFFPEPR